MRAGLQASHAAMHRPATSTAATRRRRAPRPALLRPAAALLALACLSPALRPAAALRHAAAPRRATLLRSQDAVDLEDLDALLSPYARIEFVEGVDETVVPTIKMTRSATSSRDGEFFTGTATFWFDKADALFRDITADSLITGMRLCDEEGVVETADVKAEFRRGNPAGITAVLVLSSPDEWNRFMRFMTRFADQSGLAFTAAQGMRGTEGAGGS